MKKLICILLAISIFLCIAGCGKTKMLHCDSCGKEVYADEDSDMNEDWIVYCETCHEELFGDDPILGND